MRTLLLDIETAPNLATVWGIFNQNIGINQILKSGYTLCWSAKWKGSREILFDSVRQSTQKRMLSRMHRLLDDADEVVSFNGKRFDIPTLNWEFLKLEMRPPAPYRHIDLYQDAKRFRKPSSKLDYICKELGLGSKTHHKGHELWLGCMNGDAASWRTMERYNRNDVVLLEKLYDRLIAWRKPGVNRSVEAGHLCCPNCGSQKGQHRGVAYTAAGSYPRIQCTGCGTWYRGNFQRRTPTRGVALAA